MKPFASADAGLKLSSNAPERRSDTFLTDKMHSKKARTPKAKQAQRQSVLKALRMLGVT